MIQKPVFFLLWREEIMKNNKIKKKNQIDYKMEFCRKGLLTSNQNVKLKALPQGNLLLCKLQHIILECFIVEKKAINK